MYFAFVNEKNEFSFVPMLGKITFPYCNNPDGEIYAAIEYMGKSNRDVVCELLRKLGCALNKKNVLILNLLVNPFFNELCDFIRNNSALTPCKKNFLKKYIFQYLSDDLTASMYNDDTTSGSSIYKAQNMYASSKEILKLL